MSFMSKIKPHKKPVPSGLSFKNPPVWIATWFGSGLLRPAPGTLGTLAAVPFGFAIQYLFGYLALAAAAVIMLAIGTRAADIYGRASGEKDDQSIVVDEVVGLWIAAIPAENDISLWILAVILFRLFDIYKPWPASYFDKRAGSGFDVMMDDVIAGIYAFIGVATAAFFTMIHG